MREKKTGNNKCEKFATILKIRNSDKFSVVKIKTEKYCYLRWISMGLHAFHSVECHKVGKQIVHVFVSSGNYYYYYATRSSGRPVNRQRPFTGHWYKWLTVVFPATLSTHTLSSGWNVRFTMQVNEIINKYNMRICHIIIIINQSHVTVTVYTRRQTVS